MKFLEKMSSKMAKTASTAVKDEVKSTALDLLPTIIGIGGLALGVAMLKSKPSGGQFAGMTIPKFSTITINNYYFCDEKYGRAFLNGGQQAAALPTNQSSKRKQRKR